MSFNVFNYENVPTLLAAAFKYKCQQNPSFTVRGWAYNIKFSSPKSFYQVISGERRLPKKYIQQVCDSLKLKKIDADYFRTLVYLSHAKESESDYQALLSQIEQIKKLSNFEFKKIDHNLFFTNPLCSIIKTYLSRKDSSKDIGSLNRTFMTDFTLCEISKAVEILSQMGCIDFDGAQIKLKESVALSNKIDVLNESVQMYHEKMSLKSIEIMRKTNPSFREFNSFAINIKMSELSSAKQRLQSFIKEFMLEFEEMSADSTYHLNLQFFPTVLKELEK